MYFYHLHTTTLPHPRCFARVTPSGLHTPNCTTLITLLNYLIHVSVSGRSTNTPLPAKIFNNLLVFVLPRALLIHCFAHTAHRTTTGVSRQPPRTPKLPTKQSPPASHMYSLASAVLQSCLESLSLSLPAASERKTRGKPVLRAVALQGAAAPCYSASSRLLVPSSPQVRLQPVKKDDQHLRPGMPLNPVHNVVDAGACL